MKRENIHLSRNLRKSQTDAEKKLWRALRNRSLDNLKFRRQFPVGKYILDFYCPECKIGIEADGGQHYSEQGAKKDEARSKELLDLGIKILRFSDRDILNNMEGVCQAILLEVNKTPHPDPLPKGARE